MTARGLVFAVPAFALLAAGGVRGGEFTYRHEHVMGTSLELRVRADGPSAAAGAEASVLAEVERLARVLSNHDPSSEFRRWQARRGAGPVSVSNELFDVLSAADQWREASGGAFDARVHGLSLLWSVCSREGRVPTASELAAARERLADPAWKLDPASRTAERSGDAPLTLDAVAKGWILERACDAASKVPGVRGLLLNVGGDLRACGETPWDVGVAPARGDSESAAPVARVRVRDRAVATSGDSQRGFRVGGRWYSHILDPRTGRPADRVASATVIAERSADADALATVCNVLSPAEGVRLVDATPGAACLIVAADGRMTRSARWAAYETAAAVPAPGAKKPEAHWSDSHELAVSFEINRPDVDNSGGRGYRRPYVVVWLEDPQGKPVRTLILWVSQGGSGPFQWIPDLKRWHLTDKVRKKTDPRELVLTMSRPTRPPGRYTVVWDGKDDLGKPAPAGEYTLQIDAAREHGTYQNLRKTVTVGGAPFRESLAGGVEIRSAGVEYREREKGTTK